jgi:hypothetical protein
VKYIKDYSIFESVSDQFFKTNKDINTWMVKVAGASIGNFKINPDLTVDTNNAMLGHLKLEYIPIQFGKVKNFHCNHNRLKSLKGCPKEVDSMSIFNNELTSFEYCPTELVDLYCSNNQFNSFDYAPKLIKGDFDFYGNNINTIKNFPKVVGEINHKLRGQIFGTKENPISEILRLVEKDKLNSFIQYLNEYDAIIDDKIILERFKDAIYMIDDIDNFYTSFSWDALLKGIKNYKVI